MSQPLLQVKDLHTYFNVEGQRAWACAGVSFDVMPGEFLGIVGESGSGKSVTALSIMRLIPDPPGRIDSGEVVFDGRDLLQLPLNEMRRVRGRDIAMIFQEPMTSLNPVLNIGRQVMEAVVLHENLSRQESRNRVIEVLDQVGIPDAGKRLKDYPHQFSGGMRQRVMIAMALICKPRLLIADEPTTALDVTIQAQILELMADLQNQREGSATILITHDLAVVAESCDRVIVMYGGRIQEVASTRDIFRQPLHPYTKGLMGSIPQEDSKGKPLIAIRGNVPAILDFPPGCRFCSRCELVEDRCRIEEPPLVDLGGGRAVRCHLVEKLPSNAEAEEAAP
jgi:oligopeptide/dipeptide ABC transporter ATP-binding protein